MRKRMLICGATGFIGKNLVKYFAEKNEYEIRATYFSRQPDSTLNVEWVQADLRNTSDVKKVVDNVDVILQFAATTSGAKDIMSKPYIHVTDNAVMNSLLLREAFEQNVEHFIFPSCTVMYQKSEAALKETDFNPSDEILPFYYGGGHTKVYLEKMCKFYANFKRTKHTVIRHSNVYGPYDKYDLERSHVTGATITKVMTSQDGKVNVWGTGEEERDLLYIEDLLEFIDLSIQRQDEYYELFNVGLGKGIKIKHLVEKVIQSSKRELKIVHDLSKPTIPTSLFLDCTRAKDVLGWEPKHSLEEGIDKTVSWYARERMKNEETI